MPFEILKSEIQFKKERPKSDVQFQQEEKANIRKENITENLGG